MAEAGLSRSRIQGRVELSPTKNETPFVSGSPMKQTSQIYLRVWQDVKRYLRGYNGSSNATGRYRPDCWNVFSHYQPI